MKLYRITDCKYIDDLSGFGASIGGGRWNSKGVFLLYTSQNISLAVLETLKRYELSRRHIPNKCLIVLDVPARSVMTIKPEDLGKGWRHDPAPQYLQKIGNAFFFDKKYLLLKVPSALNPVEYNYLINPQHKEFLNVKIISRQSIEIDRRLAKQALPKKVSYQRVKKRNYRALWIARINAALHNEGISYSEFMSKLQAKGIELDRRVLADLAVNSPETFKTLVNSIR